jgi:hypothetical protein
MSKIVGAGILGLGIAAAIFIGKDGRLVRRTRRRVRALGHDARHLLDSAEQWLGKGRIAAVKKARSVECAARSAVAAYEKLTA